MRLGTKKLLIITSLLFLGVVTASCIILNNKMMEDPDLQLSIEELREKYPINWFDEKYGDCGECATDAVGESGSPILICRFTMDEKEVDELLRIKFLNPLKDFNESQIKSILSHHSVKFNQDNYLDYRLDLILQLIETQVADLSNSNSFKNRIRNFLYSEAIAKSFTRLTCQSLANFDEDSKYYDLLAINYLMGMYRKLPKIKKSSFENRLRRCIAKGKLQSIREKILIKVKSKIKE